MSNKSARQCSVEMAKWKNALVMYDPVAATISGDEMPDRIQAVGNHLLSSSSHTSCQQNDYDACRPSENVLGVNDRVVGNVSTGIVSSQINQCNASYVVRGVLIGMMAYGKFMGRALESAGAMK